MNLYASKTPRDLNRIRRDFEHARDFCRYKGTLREWADAPAYAGWDYRAPQRNRPNPILVKYRTIPATSQGWWLTGFIAAAERARFASWSDEQVDHARRVLTRLARFQEHA